MNIPAFGTVIAIAAALVILGIFLVNGILLNLVAGYNMLSKEEKQKIDGKRLGRIAGIFLFAVAFMLILTVVCLIFFPGHEMAIALTLLASLILGVCILFFIQEPKKK